MLIKIATIFQERDFVCRLQILQGSDTRNYSTIGLAVHDLQQAVSHHPTPIPVEPYATLV